MEESVALDSINQKDFIKSVTGIKKLIKKGKIEKVSGNKSVKRLVKERKEKRPKPVKGLVYLSHIPHGFYEHEMTQYFSQFGGVTNVRVIRSKRTGKSKGYAFVEFADPAVAQIVADTMNNYLMGKRLLKAKYIPPQEQKVAFRKKWNGQNNPTINRKREFIKRHNEDKTEEQYIEFAKKTLSRINKNKRKLKELGIDYSFFEAVDVPDKLMGLNKTPEEIENKENENKVKVKPDRKRKRDVEEIVVEEQSKVVKKPKALKKYGKVLVESQGNTAAEQPTFTKKLIDKKQDKFVKNSSAACVNGDTKQGLGLAKTSKDKLAKKVTNSVNDFEEPDIKKTKDKVAKKGANSINDFELVKEPNIIKKTKDKVVKKGANGVNDFKGIEESDIIKKTKGKVDKKVASSASDFELVKEPNIIKKTKDKVAKKGANSVNGFEVVEKSNMNKTNAKVLSKILSEFKVEQLEEPKVVKKLKDDVTKKRLIKKGDKKGPQKLFKKSDSVVNKSKLTKKMNTPRYFQHNDQIPKENTGDEQENKLSKTPSIIKEIKGRKHNEIVEKKTTILKKTGNKVTKKGTKSVRFHPDLLKKNKNKLKRPKFQ